jgi:hypothetical protein
MKKKLGIILVFFLLVLTIAQISRSNPPQSFTETGSSEKIELKISGEYTYDEAWQIVADYVRSQFETEMENKEEGFIQTLWIYPPTGKLAKTYRNRLTLQFSPDRYTLNILLEAEFQKHGILGINTRWVKGTDNTFGKAISPFIKNKIGRIG